MNSSNIRILIVSLSILLSCQSANKDEKDPLRNSKKLISEGHKSLYFQGALPIKGTSIRFIPPMEEAEIHIYGRRFGFAKSEFSKSVKRAAESVIVVKEGTKASWSYAKDISDGGNDAINYLQKNATDSGIYIMYASTAMSYDLVGSSFNMGLATHNQIVADSDQLRKDWNSWADESFKDPKNRDKSPEMKKRWSQYNKTFKNSFQSFVIGYVDMDDALKSAWDESYEDMDGGTWKDSLMDVNKLRTDVSESISSAWTETVFNYGQDAKAELKDAGKDIESIAEGKGVSYSLLKAFAKTTKAIFYDSIIKPIGKIGVLSVGYIGVNALVYPAAVVTVGATTGVYVLVETLAVTGKGIVYIIAPNVKLALGALLGSSQIVLGESYESLKAGGNASTFAARKTSKYMTKGAAIVTEKSGRYILAPVSLLGVTASQTVYGGGLAVTGVTTGGIITASSAAVQTTTYVGSKATAGVVGTTGTVLSFGTGTAFGIYYLTKSVGVPSGVVLGSVVVMNYEMTAQLSAHSILAVADCSYLVLSLEGGKWVVYGVKDVTGKAGGLLSGAVIDLDQVRKEGGTVVKVPMGSGDAEKIFDPKKEKSN